MYIPSYNLMNDKKEIVAFISNNPFAIIVTTENERLLAEIMIST